MVLTCGNVNIPRIMYSECNCKKSKVMTLYMHTQSSYTSSVRNVYFLFCRALLVYCLRHYKGDDKIKSFIWDLITPTKEGQDQALLNHSG